MAWLKRLRVFGVEQQGAHWMARALPDGWLAIVSHGGEGTLVALADDVPGPQVAAVVRHVLAEHSTATIAVCRAPACPAAREWRDPRAASAPAVEATA